MKRHLPHGPPDDHIAGRNTLHFLRRGGGAPDTETPSAASIPSEKPQSLPAGTSIPADASTKGMFGPLKTWPLIAVHGVLTPDGRVLSYGTKADGQQTGYFIYDVWDPSDDSHLTLTNNTQTDIFCSSQLLLPGGGDIVVNGGDNWTGTATTTGRTTTQHLQRRHALAHARQHHEPPALVFQLDDAAQRRDLHSGRQRGTDFPEIRGANGTYRLMTGAGTGAYDFMYPRNFIAPDGRVFGYDSGGRMYYINTSGSGSVTTAGPVRQRYRGQRFERGDVRAGPHPAIRWQLQRRDRHRHQ